MFLVQKKKKKLMLRITAFILLALKKKVNLIQPAL